MKTLKTLLTLALTTGAATAGWAGDIGEMAIAREVIAKSGITAARAIDIAKSTFKGTVYQYEIDDEHNQFVYKIELASPAKQESYKVEIDASNGQVIHEAVYRNQNSRKNMHRFAAAEAIQKAGFTVKDAIAKISPKGQPMVQEVEFESKMGINCFEVETVDASGKQKVLIDIDKKSIVSEFKP